MRLTALLLLVVASYGVSAQCSAPTNLSTLNITATAGTAIWAPVTGATSYNLDYKPASSSDWVTIANGTTSLQWTIGGMNPSTSYDWRVRANCASGISSYAQTQFTTGAPGSCSAPGGLSTTNITSTTATMNWTPVSGAFAYTVEYKATSSNSWLTASSATYSTSYNLYGLTAGTSYNWRVYSNCSLIETSGWSSIAEFTAGAGSGSGSGSGTGSGSGSGSGSNPPIAPSCPGPYDVTTNGNMSGAASITVNTDVKGTIARKNDIDYYKFTINTGGTFTVYLTTLPANYNLAVFNSSGTEIGSSQNNGTQSEMVPLNGAAGIYYAKVFPKGPANNLVTCYTLRVQTATATRVATTEANSTAIATTENMNPNPNFTVNLFPNPASARLNVWVEGSDNKSVIKVYSLMGKLVMQQESSDILTQLNISKLPAGLYLVHVNDGKLTSSAKFVKQ